MNVILLEESINQQKVKNRQIEQLKAVYPTNKQSTTTTRKQQV